MESFFTTPNFLSPEFFGRFDGFRKLSADSAKRLEGMNLKLTENLMKKQAELISFAMDTGNRTVALYSEGKALPEILSAQAKLASDYGSRLFSLVQETGTVFADCQSEYRSWLEEGYKEFSEQMQSVTSEFNPLAKTKAG